MRNARELLIWTLVGLAGAALVVVAGPGVFPLLPGSVDVSRSHAETVALERLRDLGEPVERPYVATQLRTDLQLERRLQVLASAGAEIPRLRDSRIARTQMVWEVLVYPPSAARSDWAYLAWISTRDGQVLALRRNSARDDEIDEEEAALAADAARRRAAEHLEEQGFDLTAFDPEPEVRPGDAGSPAAIEVRFRDREVALGEEYPYGVQVHFKGERFDGYEPWFEDPYRDQLQSTFRQTQILSFGRVILFYFLLPFVAVPFLRRYHDGQLGVRRGMQFFLLCLAMGTLLMILVAESASSNVGLGAVSRQQTTYLVILFAVVFQFLGLAVLALMSWSVGESLCRERWPQKLASIDAVFRLKWANATVARSSLRGLAAGVLMAGLLTAGCALLQRVDAWAMATIGYSSSGLDSSLPSLAAIGGNFAYAVPISLFVCLLVPSWAVRRFGTTAGLGLAILGSIVISPVLIVMPLSWAIALWAVVAPIPVLLFWFGDYLSALLASLTVNLVLNSLPMLASGVLAYQAHGLAALLVLAAPLIVSLRHLGSGREFVYTYDDVPAHVRRIAERERQRVELETARNIQSSILPQLPPRLQGVDIAHAYLPATEVGGDFYDVLALEDGRLAVAVGDVAGHGVSSGLVMSMAKSALAVQVTFNPAVDAVLTTLNRMVYQSARRRLLSTLCYAILDPERRELYYASAGHVFPYRVSPNGEVEALRAESYPLGVRSTIEVRQRTSKLAPGDVIFMYSDGLVEATAEGGDEQFGFERLEQSLERHAALAPEQMRDAVLADVEVFTGRGNRDDDLTVLVLRLPAAA